MSKPEDGRRKRDIKHWTFPFRIQHLSSLCSSSSFICLSSISSSLALVLPSRGSASWFHYGDSVESQPCAALWLG